MTVLKNSNSPIKESAFKYGSWSSRPFNAQVRLKGHNPFELAVLTTGNCRSRVGTVTNRTKKSGNDSPWIKLFSITYCLVVARNKVINPMSRNKIENPASHQPLPKTPKTSADSVKLRARLFSGHFFHWAKDIALGFGAFLSHRATYPVIIHF